jgi:pullulanase/glycogen debranching enzyme
VELCLFDPSGRHEIQRIELRERTDETWRAYLPEAWPGLLYGYRVQGPYEPEKSHRFNPHKLLIEPYAKHLQGELRWSDAHFGYRIGHAEADLSFDKRDNARGMPKSRVIDPAFTWGDDRAPRIPWHDTVIYELHVRGFTMQHPQIPQELRGTYAGLATAPAIDHLLRLGVRTVELLPVQAFADDRSLLDKGLRNYWGHNTIAFFAPEMRYSASDRISEFKTMVKTLHSAGIEIILDVVYNHTAEGNQLGPTLAFRGVEEDAEVNSLRHRRKRNLIASLLLSQGVPMLLADDELSYTQNGNNNAYCQDNGISWLDWNLTPEKTDFLEFVAQMIKLRRLHPVFSRRRFLRGQAVGAGGLKDIAWLSPDGREMTADDWAQQHTRCLGVSLSGSAIERTDKRGRQVTDANFLVLLNVHHETVPFSLPELKAENAWASVFDTTLDHPMFRPARFGGGLLYSLKPRSLALLIETR